MRELRGVEGLTVVQKSPWWVERCRARRAMVANAAWVYESTLDPGSAIFTWAVEFSGQVVSGGSQGQGSFVDRSDEIVIGTTERVVEARTVHRMPAGQQGDASAPWQPQPRQLRANRWAWPWLVRSLPMVPIPAVRVMEPRDCKACGEVELAKCER